MCIVFSPILELVFFTLSVCVRRGGRREGMWLKIFGVWYSQCTAMVQNSEDTRFYPMKSLPFAQAPSFPFLWQQVSCPRSNQFYQFVEKLSRGRCYARIWKYTHVILSKVKWQRTIHRALCLAVHSLRTLETIPHGTEICSSLPSLPSTPSSFFVNDCIVFLGLSSELTVPDENSVPVIHFLLYLIFHICLGFSS